ncbi:MAG: MBOAT family protein [Betaproteobacteria bacterium]|nr:MAG: MBOAT family protein [Betaproteobacteria bacterium]
MLFTSLGFFVFLAVVLAVFAALPPGRRWLWLLAASYLFYGVSQPSNLIYLGAVTLVVIASARALERTTGARARRALLAAGLVIVLGALFASKLFEAFATQAGFSFYAFSAASYLIDAYARRLPGHVPAGQAALYLAWFPKILAGPIERAPGFLPQACAGLRADPERVVLGLQLALWGLFKKVVIADNLAPIVDRSFAIAAFASPIELAISIYFFAFQIYCDFSGYADIAIGVSLLFGVQLMENFRRPYLSRSTAEFWGERWHISLGRWFRDYLYIPLGGSRAGRLRQYANLMTVFLVSGVWHAGLGYGVGWSFVVWGALNGLYQWAGLATRSFWRRAGDAAPRVRASRVLLVLRVLLTFHLIALSWVFFRAKSVGEAWLILERIGARLAEMPALLSRYPFTAEHYTGLALIALLVAVEIADERRSIFRRLAAAPAALRWGACYLAIFAMLLLGRWQAREFIYMQF